MTGFRADVVVLECTIPGSVVDDLIYLVDLKGPVLKELLDT